MSSQARITGYGVGAPSIKLNPPPIVSTRAPTTSDYHYPLGQNWVDTTTMSAYELASVQANTATWLSIGGGSSVISTINNLSPTAGNFTLAGTSGQITATSAGSTITFSVPAAFTAPGSILATTTVSSTTSMTAGTGFTATAGNITATDGDFVASTAGTGLIVPIATGSGAASGTVTCNGRQGAVSFTSPSIAAGATLTLTMGNSSVTGSSTFIHYSISGATTGSALSIQSISNSAGSSAVVLTNGTGATTQTGTITLNFIILN